MRDADQIPQCFSRSGPFDDGEVEAFFAARRDAMLDPKAAPLVPLSKLAPEIQARWRQYLGEKAKRATPMKGTRRDGGELLEARVAATLKLLTVTESPSRKVTAVTESPSVTESPAALSKLGRPKSEAALTAADRARAYRQRRAIASLEGR